MACPHEKSHKSQITTMIFTLHIAEQAVELEGITTSITEHCIRESVTLPSEPCAVYIEDVSLLLAGPSL